jgi:glutathione peroxidase
MSLDRNIVLTTIEGQSVRLADYADKALLVVNVASKCGFTPQYKGLEALQRQFGDRGFAVLGFPCDQFGHQEPGDEADTHPLFQALKKAAPGLLGSQAIKWNFTKFLIGRDGKVRRRYAPADGPASLAGDVEAALSAP